MSVLVKKSFELTEYKLMWTWFSRGNYGNCLFWFCLVRHVLHLLFATFTTSFPGNLNGNGALSFYFVDHALRHSSDNHIHQSCEGCWEAFDQLAFSVERKKKLRGSVGHFGPSDWTSSRSVGATMASAFWVKNRKRRDRDCPMGERAARKCEGK